jgi:hypothetical protein
VTDLEQALPAATLAIEWTSGLVGLLGAAAILLARRGALAVVPRARWIKGLVAASAVALVLLNAGDTIGWAGDLWTDFKTAGYSDVPSGPGRLTGSLDPDATTTTAWQ